jgi:hypothetical protein
MGSAILLSGLARPMLAIIVAAGGCLTQGKITRHHSVLCREITRSGGDTMLAVVCLNARVVLDALIVVDQLGGDAVW